jgi:UPF0042 nucleotide-binding protein
LLLITGLSGAGRSLTADHLEDLGWFAIDNLPPWLVPKVTEDFVGALRSPSVERVALSVGSGPDEDDLLPMLGWLRSAVPQACVLFLEAANETLVRRFDATRRRHPMSRGNGEQHLMAAIERERRLLEPVKARADVVLDTSELNIHELRLRIRALFADDHDRVDTHATLMSFGYKHGLPLDADLVLDCRFIPNPHWVKRLRPYTGLEKAVSDYVLEQHSAQDFLTDLLRMLNKLLPRYSAEGKAYLTIALGCTGGRHRSVALTERFAAMLRSTDTVFSVIHRDVEK